MNSGINLGLSCFRGVEWSSYFAITVLYKIFFFLVLVDKDTCLYKMDVGIATLEERSTAKIISDNLITLHEIRSFPKLNLKDFFRSFLWMVILIWLKNTRGRRCISWHLMIRIALTWKCDDCYYWGLRQFILDRANWVKLENWRFLNLHLRNWRLLLRFSYDVLSPLTYSCLSLALFNFIKRILCLFFLFIWIDQVRQFLSSFFCRVF